jgi:hypothetical protein
VLAISNSIQEEIKSRFKLGNACYHLVQNLLSSRLLSKNLKKSREKKRKEKEKKKRKAGGDQVTPEDGIWMPKCVGDLMSTINCLQHP